MCVKKVQFKCSFFFLFSSFLFMGGCLQQIISDLQRVLGAHRMILQSFQDEWTENWPILGNFGQVKARSLHSIAHIESE